MSENTFAKELEQLVNRYSIENHSNTPDFILAQYLLGCLGVFNSTVQRREQWYGRGAQYVAGPHDHARIAALPDAPIAEP